jgi:hypothetical protein
MTSPDPLAQQPPAVPPPGYPAQQYGPPPGPPQYAPAPPKKTMSQGKIALIAVGSSLAFLGLFAVLLLLANGSTGSSGYEAEMVRCHTAGGGFDIVGAQADVAVKNKTSRTHSYTITVAFTDATQTTQYATATASISDLQPGQVGQATATSWQGGNASVQGCKILRVHQSVF